MPFRRNVNPNISMDKSPQILISKPKITKTQEINTEREAETETRRQRIHEKQQIKGSPKLQIIILSAIEYKNYFK